MPKILVIVPFALDADGVTRRRHQLSTVKLDPESDFHFRPVKAGPKAFMSPHDFTLMDVAIFEAGAEAQNEGFDAVCIDTMSEFRHGGPALGAGHSSRLAGQGIDAVRADAGVQFSVLAQWKPALFRYKRALVEYGLRDQCASVRSFDIPPDFDSLLDGKQEKAFPKMRDACLQCVEEDGAEVICLGSTTMYQAAEWLAERVPVPVINPGPLTYKLVETMLALRLAHSRTAYPTPLSPQIPMLHAMLDAVAKPKGADAPR